MALGSPRPLTPRVALVLAGGSARGAYEVGVAQYLVEDVSRALGRDVPIDILCGTSVGAINACGLAAFAHEPKNRVGPLARAWRGLRVNHVIRPDTREMFAMARRLLGGNPSGKRDHRGGVLDPSGLQRIVATALPFGNIHDNIRSGRLHALTVSSTHIATGRTIVWVERHGAGLPRWSRDATVEARATRITPVHALASAAIPFFFPAVRIDSEYHCDGGLRQNVPLSPARRLGADGIIVISPKHVDLAPPSPQLMRDMEDAYPSPLFLLGKVLNALLLDRLENDIDRLQRMTAVLDAGTRLYGPGFIEAVNRDLGNEPDRAIRPLRTVLVRASHDIGRLAAAFVRSPAFTSRASGLVGRVLRRLAEGDAARESDLLSYLLFDGEFARQLIEMGRSDARARHDDLCTFYEQVLAGPARRASEPEQQTGT